MTDFTKLVDLASEQLGGRVLLANDEFFAPKKNLLKLSKPVFIEGKYTERGKWMDGWETRRRRTPGYDWCVVRLGAPGVIRGVIVDTSFFRGNYPEACSLETCSLEASAVSKKLLASDDIWTEILGHSSLKGDSENQFAITATQRCTHLRFKIYPDGGVARLRVFGDVVPHWGKVLYSDESIDLAAIQNGGKIAACSDKFFSSPQNLLMPGKSTHMGDGWETKRRRGPGYDWVILRLGIAGEVQEIKVDTAHFKGNFPESCSVEICDTGAFNQDADVTRLKWKQLIARTKLAANKLHSFKIKNSGQVTHVRLNIFPDGGVARLRVLGKPTADGLRSAMLGWFNSLPQAAAEEVLIDCCSSRAWAKQLAATRPFDSPDNLLSAAGRAAESMSRSDWIEAFSGHPEIGRKKPSGSKGSKTWSMQEQSAAATSSAGLSAIRTANEVYHSRFGHIFIICANGKPAEEILRELHQRLTNDPEREFAIACGEQRKITNLRLEKMLSL